MKSRRKNLSEPSASRAPEASLRISEVAQRVGISSSALRAWEALGLVTPQRTRSRYRLYNEKDVRLLKRAIFLRRARGLNPAAIVHVLKRQGVVSAAAESVASPGSRFRRLRQRRNLSLAQVARSTGVSVGFLSALERSQMSASVGTLRKLARYYKSNILDFYDTTEPTKHLVRPGARKVLEAGPGVRMELLAWGNTIMEPHLFRIAPSSGSGESYTHVGEEFLFVLKGELQIFLRGEEYRLKSGDSFYFESAVPHTWSNPGRAETVVLWVNTPPTF